MAGSGNESLSARILYWGIEGAGKSANLQVIHQRLRADHRGDLEIRGTRLDPTVTYEVLPIELGQVSGVPTRIQVTSVPSAPDHGPTRKGLLDRVEGIVFVVDAQRERIDANLACFEELRTSLAAYGRSLDDVPLVIQYNKSDLSDPYALEELHRKLETRGAAAFEATARDGRGVLETLTTISKRVVRSLRERAESEPVVAERLEGVPAPAEIVAPRSAGPLADTGLETAIAAEALAPGASAAAETALATQALLETAFEEARAEALEDAGHESASLGDVSVVADLDAAAHAGGFALADAGPARAQADGTIHVPLRLRDAEGREVALTLHLRLDVEGA